MDMVEFVRRYARLASSQAEGRILGPHFTAGAVRIGIQTRRKTVLIVFDDERSRVYTQDRVLQGEPELKGLGPDIQAYMPVLEEVRRQPGRLLSSSATVFG